MSLEIKENQKLKIYESHLKEIDGVSFTIREVDVIACILHGRGVQNISSLLQISGKTVGAHIYNVRGKLGYIPKSQIIDFIEKSGKLPFLKLYYFHLLVDSSFKKCLNKINKLVSKQNILCHLDQGNVQEEHLALVQRIVENIETSGITISMSKRSITNANYKIIICSQHLPKYPPSSDLIYIRLKNNKNNLDNQSNCFNFSDKKKLLFITLKLTKIYIRQV